MAAKAKGSLKSGSGGFIGKTQPAPFPGNGSKAPVPSGRFGATGKASGKAGGKGK